MQNEECRMAAEDYDFLPRLGCFTRGDALPIRVKFWTVFRDYRHRAVSRLQVGAPVRRCNPL